MSTQDTMNASPADPDMLSHAFDSGNYASAYETTDLDQAWERQTGWYDERYFAEFARGFFSTYEIHEIPEKYRGVVLQARRSAGDEGATGYDQCTTCGAHFDAGPDDKHPICRGCR